MYLVFWWFLTPITHRIDNHGGVNGTVSVTIRSFWVTNKSTLVCLSLDRIPILFPFSYSGGQTERRDLEKK
ncbi:hypothetical protein L873DRAFT_1802792 [Choiromyces venosus 120613-1]|uniref:Uncharacterized protein n=1 Tax=Choiromyces venosus 120613-1 TaxID=1336337 RepID=A0A3N4JUE5_9PEZI|nr:hypothetical protein L873DRAFT_1802792 [Choiromyces venosus 120613-1]